jgi:DNA repair protein RadD
MLTLRDYQQSGVDSIRESFRSGKKAPLYVCPTGGGKTVIFSYIAITTAAKAKRVLILVHRIELLRQTSAKLYEAGVEHGLINAKFTPNMFASVQVASVQTLVRRIDKVRTDYDLIIIDEAHHAVASTWKKILNKIKENSPKCLTLGVTATPIRSDGTGLIDMFDDLILGPSIKQLTERGFLVPSVVYAPTEKIDFSKVKITNGDYDQYELENLVDNSVITGSAVEYYKKICPGVPAIVFCVSVKHAEHVAEEFRAAGFRSQSVDGSMDDAVRKKLIAGLSNGMIQVLTSCDLVSEGTDIPAVRCGILLRPTQSTGLFLQQIGRTLRLAPGKTMAWILDHVANVLNHGMPDEEREWSLEGEDQRAKKKKKDAEPNVRVKQCPACFAMHGPATKCPLCGHIYEVESEEPSIKEGELRQITEEDSALLKRARNKEVGRAKTFDDLVAIGTARGYKPGWAKHIWESRQKKGPVINKNAPPPHTEEPAGYYRSNVNF